MKAVLWVTADFNMKQLLAAVTDNDKLKECFVAFHDYDINGWVKVGECDVTPTFITGEELAQASVAAIDAEIKQVQQEYGQKLALLTGRRQDLLSLPAPSTNPEHSA